MPYLVVKLERMEPKIVHCTTTPYTLRLYKAVQALHEIAKLNKIEREELKQRLG